MVDFTRIVRDSCKPCPFCGKKPRLFLDPLRGMIRLGCRNESCTIRPQVPLLVSPDGKGDLRHAVNLWNKRINKKGD